MGGTDNGFKKVGMHIYSLLDSLDSLASPDSLNLVNSVDSLLGQYGLST